MSSILTVTLNPALDLAAECEAVLPGTKLRVSNLRTEPGGGGVNVSRAIRLLGGRSTAFVAWAGALGTLHRRLLEGDGVAVLAHDVKGETRQSLTVTDATGQQFRFVLPGPDWDVAQAETARTAIFEAAPSGLVVLSGSQPPRLSDGFAQDLAAALGPDRLIVDTSEAALKRLVTQPRPGKAPWVLRMDQGESEAIAGSPLRDVDASRALAASLVARGVAKVVVVARGADGSVLASDDGTLHCAPPPVPVRSKVGAGDSFTAALALSLSRTNDLAQALRQGTAAAAAAVMTEGSALCRAEDVARLAPLCSISRHPGRAGA